MGLINSVNLIIWLEKKKISTTNQTKQSPIIHYKIWMFVNIMKVYFYNILKSHNDQICYQSEN